MRLFNKSLLYFTFSLIWILSTSNAEAKPTHFHFDFSTGNQNWQGDFTDYPIGQETFYELAWGWDNLPTPLDSLSKGIFLSGNNHSDDLFMFIRRRVDGLKPNTFYDITFQVTIEDNIFPEQFGIGGSPGESVFFKVGASTKEPHKVDIRGFYILNVDKGNQADGGKNAIVVGDLANPLVNPDTPQFEPKVFDNHNNPLRIKTDNKGGLWLFVGTDSGFEGSTLYYIAHISVEAKRIHH